MRVRNPDLLIKLTWLLRERSVAVFKDLAASELDSYPQARSFTASSSRSNCPSLLVRRKKPHESGWELVILKGEAWSGVNDYGRLPCPRDGEEALITFGIDVASAII